MTGLYSMTPAEIEILHASVTKPNILLGYFLRRPGQEIGWQFDHNFTEKGRWQEDMCLASQSFIVVISGIASGKAQPLDAKVLTPSGWTTMGDLKVEDYVSTSDGVPARVLGIYHQGKRPVYKITLNTGDIIRADREHLWSIQRRSGRNYSNWTTIELLEGIEKYGSRKGGTGFFLPPLGIIHFTPRNISIEPYLLGLLLGDGCLGEEAISISTADEEIVDYVTSAIGIYGLSPKKRKGSNYDYYLSRDILKGSNENRLMTELKKLGLHHANSHNKFIPKEYIYNTTDIRTTILQGLLDTDGAVSRDCAVEYSTCSKQLALDVREIVLSLGGHANISKRQTKCNGKEFESYRLYISFREWPFIPFRLQRKAKRLSRKINTGGSHRKKIISVEFDCFEDTKCIYVDHPDHLYITDGWAPTHNTLGVGMAAATHAVLTPGFKFLNIARESWQSQLMYSILLEHISGTIFEKLVVNSPKRPYPAIVIEYMNGNQKVHSTLEFMSIGEEKDATNIFSWRGDWVNIDEAGRLDNLSEIVGNLSTRGTGVTPDGRPYLGRISIISNPWENIDMWQLFDMAATDKEDSLAINLETSDNLNVTPKQIKQVLKLIPEGEKDRFLSGKRPEGRGAYFSKATVEKCESQILSKSLIDAVDKCVDGYERIHLGYLGTFFFKTPRKEGRLYFITGDPGTGTAPSRNAPVVTVWDVTEVPKGPAVLVALHWGNGGGSITPFVSQLIEWIDYYKPVFCGVDSTGPQKNTAEIINLEYISGQGKSIDGITGLDFSGSKKYSLLVSLRLSLESRALIWPHVATGVSAQLKHYDPIIDRSTNSKLAQDIVSTLAMAAFAIRAHYGAFDQKDSEEDSNTGGKSSLLRRQSRIGTNRKSRDTIPSTRGAFGATGTKKTTVGDLDEYILPH